MPSPRMVVLPLLTAAALTRCAAGPSIRSFPVACPSGWVFLYTDSGKRTSDGNPLVVCRDGRDSTAVTRPQ